MLGPLGAKSGPRLCGGTPFRSNVYGQDGIVVMKPEPAMPGCGDPVSVHVVRETLPQPALDGEAAPRPLFVKTAPVVLCPHCDGVTLPISLIQAPEPLAGEPTEPADPDAELGQE